MPSDPDPDSGSDPDPGPDSGSDPDPDPDSGSDPDPDHGSPPATDAETGPGTATAIPAPGFGTYDLHGESGAATIRDAIEAGYRHVDTARMYENEDAVGDALEAADVDRSEVFVATKVGHFTEPALSPEYIRTSVRESRAALGIETIDLLYVHWPYSFDAADHVPALESLVAEGWVDALGVSNFTPPQLDETLALTDHVLALQAECHPLLPQDELRAYCDDHDLTFVAYSPLAQGQVFDVPVLVEIADEHDATPAQVSLAWLRRKGVVPIPKTASTERARENLDGFRMELTDEDVERIDAIDRRERLEDEPFMDW